MEVFSMYRPLETVIERFNLNFHSEDTIEEACKKNGNNPDFMLEILKAYSSTEYFPKRELNIFSATYIIDYLRKTHLYYLNKKLPEIEQSIDKLIDKFSDSHSELIALTRIFTNYQKELSEHILQEEQKLFPYIENLIKVKQHGKSFLNPEYKNYSVIKFMQEHHDDEQSLAEIRKIITKHSPVSTIAMPYRIFLIQLELFEKDLSIHAKVEDEILIPKIIRLEKELLINEYGTL